MVQLDVLLIKLTEVSTRYIVLNENVRNFKITVNLLLMQ